MNICLRFYCPFKSYPEKSVLVYNVVRAKYVDLNGRGGKYRGEAQPNLGKCTQDLLYRHLAQLHSPFYASLGLRETIFRKVIFLHHQKWHINKIELRSQTKISDNVMTFATKYEWIQS